MKVNVACCAPRAAPGNKPAVHRFGCKRFAGYPIYVELNYQKRDERVTGRFKHTKNRACGCPVMQNEGKPVHLCNCPHLRKGDIIWTGSKFAEAVNVPEREAPITGHLSCGCPIMTFKGVQLHMDGCERFAGYPIYVPLSWWPKPIPGRVQPFTATEINKDYLPCGCPSFRTIGKQIHFDDCEQMKWHREELKRLNRQERQKFLQYEFHRQNAKPRIVTEVTMLESFKIQCETLQSQLRLCAACERESTKLRRMHGDCGRVTAYGYSLGEKDQVRSPYYRRQDCWKFPSKWCDKCLDPDSDNGNLRYPCGKAMSPMVMPDVGGAPEVCFRTGPKCVRNPKRFR
jgi:hypothetical protein